MAVREAAPPGLLERFSAPLWDRLGLTELRAEWIVRGEHREHEWMVVELAHRATGLMAESGSDTTTVFMVRLPRKSTRWHLPAARITSVQQVCVDDEWVYVAALGQQPRVRDWRRWLDMAIAAAQEVVQAEARPPAEIGTGGTGNAPKPEASEDPEPGWNPHDGPWMTFWLAVAVLLGVAVLWILSMEYTEWQRHGAIVKCNPQLHIGTAVRGWKVVLYLGLLAMPLLGVGKLLHTAATRLHRPGFVLQINVEGFGLLAGCWALTQVLDTLTVVTAC